jgi:uncharacterized membrane protein YjgN (DUF898 family)
MTVVDATADTVPAGPAAPADSAERDVPDAGAVPTARFIGNRKVYWRLLIRGAVLLAVTLGIYRFWFATDVRRFLWAHTEIAGDTLEYTGTPYELVIGFLIAVAVLLPLNALLFLLALSLPIGELVGVLAFPVIAFLGQFAIYRARRYRLTRSVFRGIRCHQTGSALRYAVSAMLWWLLIIFTLGLAYPFAQASLERYKIRNTYYGDLGGAFAGSGSRLFLRGFAMWLLVIGPIAGALAFAAEAVDWGTLIAAASGANDAGSFANQVENAFPGLYPAMATLITAVTVSTVMAILLFPVFQAMMMRWWLSGLRFGSLTVRSKLRIRHIYGAYLRFLLYIVLFLIALGIVGGIALAVFGTVGAAYMSPDMTEIVGAAGAVASYVVVMLGFSTIYQGTVRLALWQRAVDTAEIEGLTALDHVKAAGTASSAVGEGLADALNVGGI